jgi:hypothetical protein
MTTWATQLFTWLGHGQYQTAPTAVAAGGTAPLLIDQYGRLVTVPAVPGASVNVSATNWADSSAVAVSGQIAAAPATLLKAFATSTSGGFFLQLFDSASAPTSASVPAFVAAVPGVSSPDVGTTIAVDLHGTGKQFASGIQWGASSALATFTAISAADCWVNAETA